MSLPSPWKRLGGKANLHRWIISHLPAHESYIEVFGGAASVLLNKPRISGQEVYNDLDGLWFNSFTVLRDHCDALADALASTPYSRAEFLHAKKTMKQWRRKEVTLNDIGLARLHMIELRQSFSADGTTWSTSTFGGENRPQLWARLPNELRRFMMRLRGVYLEQRDYHYIFERYDHPQATLYCDPPYLNVENKYYDVNRADGFDHEALRAAVETLKGSVVLSYYAGDIEHLYKGWQIERREVTVHAGEEKRKETEILIIRHSEYARKRGRKVIQEIFDDEGNDLILK